MLEASFDFVFLRQWWLLALLPLLLVPALQRRRSGSSDWYRHLPQPVVQRLVRSQESRTTKRPVWQLQLLLALIVITLAGPSLIRQSVPALQNKNAVVAVLDLSLSMYVADQKPNRLERARQKIYDVLKRRSDGLTGLVVFAGSAHVVAPLTDDRETLRSMLPALDPGIMPEPGANPGLALMTAADLIQQAGLDSGRILLLTDSIDRNNLEALQKVRAQLPGGIAVSVLALGTQSGGPISLPDQGFLKRSGEIVVARTDLDATRRFVSDGSSGSFQGTDAEARLSIDDSDLNTLLPDDSTFARTERAEGDRRIEQRVDQGFWLLPFIALVAIGLYRRGALLVSLAAPAVAGALLSALLFAPGPALAEESAVETGNAAQTPEQPGFWDRLWLRDDQLAEQAYQKGDFGLAADLYGDPARTGAALLQAERYDVATSTLMEAKPTADVLYNSGNALAYDGKLEDAIAAYDSAIALRENFPDAKKNRGLVAELLKQQEEQQQEQEQNGKDDQQQDQGEDQGEGDQQSQSGQQDNEKQPAPQDNEQDNGEQGGQNQDDATKQDSASQDQQGKDADDQSVDGAGMLDDSEAEDGEPAGNGEAFDLSQQQQDEWLRRIPDDPGELLQRKFLYQYRNPDSRYTGPNDGTQQSGANSARKPDARQSPGTASDNPW